MCNNEIVLEKEVASPSVVSAIVSELISRKFNVFTMIEGNTIRISYTDAKEDKEYFALNEEEADLLDYYQLGIRMRSDDENPLSNLIFDVIDGYKNNSLTCEKDEDGQYTRIDIRH